MGFNSKDWSLISIAATSAAAVVVAVGSRLCEAKDAIILLQAVMGGEIEYRVISQIVIVEGVVWLTSMMIVGLFVGTGCGSGRGWT